MMIDFSKYKVIGCKTNPIQKLYDDGQFLVFFTKNNIECVMCFTSQTVFGEEDGFDISIPGSIFGMCPTDLGDLYEGCFLPIYFETIETCIGDRMIWTEIK